MGDWGEEVIPGIHIIRRGIRSSSSGGGGSGKVFAGRVVDTSNLVEVFDAIGAVEEVLTRLRESNIYMAQYLRDEGGDEDVRAAIAENEQVIEQRQKDVIELRAIAEAFCGGGKCASEAHKAFVAPPPETTCRDPDPTAAELGQQEQEGQIGGPVVEEEEEVTGAGGLQQSTAAAASGGTFYL